MSMSSSNLAVRRPSGFRAALRGGNRPADEVAAIQEAAFVERAHAATRRDLGLLEMGDVEALTMRGVAAAANTAAQAVAEIEANPCAASGVGRILETGNSGLDRALRRYLDGE